MSLSNLQVKLGTHGNVDVVNEDLEDIFRDLEVEGFIGNFNLTIHFVALNTHNMFIRNVEVLLVTREETGESPVLGII